MRITLEKIFETRDQFDAYVKNTFGDNAEKNRDLGLVIEAEKAVLDQLQLSEDVTVHGVRVALKSSEEKEGDTNIDPALIKK